MKMEEAQEIINGEDKGFMVHFDECGDGMLRSNYFPDKHAGEALIGTEDEAWELAASFANKTYGKMVNIYVIDHNFKPVSLSREIRNR